MINKIFYKSLLLLTLILAFSCAKEEDNPLILPPNYAKLPDLDDNKTVKQLEEEDLKPLKDILLQ